MIDRNSILKRISKTEDKLLISKMLDKALKSEEIQGIVYSDFLDPYQKNLISKALSEIKSVNCTFNGGYAGAEREISLFCPVDMSPESFPDFKNPLKILDIKLKGRENLTHRDYLGALMSLGIKREKIGDIIVKEDACSVVVMSDIADYIKFNLGKIGNVIVEIEIRCVDEVQVTEPKVKEINATVASLRLDSVASAGFGISRSKIAEFIKAEKVNLNWEATNSLTKIVKEGDTISVRGKGRVVVERVGGTTKKGRISITLKKMI